MWGAKEGDMSVCLSIGRFFSTGDYRSHDDGNSTLALIQGEARRSQVKGCHLGLNGAGKIGILP